MNGSTMDGEFAGKVALVTGASSGLGASIARRLAAFGATVVGVARNQERLEAVAASVAEAGGIMTTAICDVRSPTECAAAVERVVAEYGRLDVLVNAAGNHTPRHTTEMTAEHWADDLALNLSGPFYLCAAGIPHLLESAGNIVNISSLAGHEGQPYSAGYCSAKHGIVGLTKALAIEYTATALRVNAVCPGGMMTPQIENFAIPDGADFDLIMRAAAPRGMMQPGDVAEVVAFVASDRARSLHGAVINADIGKSAG